MKQSQSPQGPKSLELDTREESKNCICNGMCRSRRVGGVRGVQSKIGLGPPFANNITPPPPKKIFSGFVIRTLLESPPTCPSQVNCMAVPTGNCLSRVSENWFRIFTLGVVIKVGLTEKK